MNRRVFLKFIGIISAYPVLSKASAPGLEPKSAVKYQDHPNNGQMCCMCVHFIPPGETKPHPCNMHMMNGGMMGGGMINGGMMHMMGGMQNARCEVVQGKISPMGWCVLFKRA